VARCQWSWFSAFQSHPRMSRQIWSHVAANLKFGWCPST